MYNIQALINKYAKIFFIFISQHCIINLIIHVLYIFQIIILCRKCYISSSIIAIFTKIKAGRTGYLSSSGFMHVMYILCIILIQCFFLRYGYCRFIAGEDLLYVLLIRFLCDQTDDRNKDQSTDHRCCTTVYR